MEQDPVAELLAMIYEYSDEVLQLHAVIEALRTENEALRSSSAAA